MPRENKADAKAKAANKAEAKALDRDADRRMTALAKSIKNNRPRGQGGSIRPVIAIPLTGLGLAVWGWSHGSRTPDGRWILAVAIVGLVVLLFATGIIRYRHIERRSAAYTKRMESGMQQDTTGDHIWDA